MSAETLVTNVQVFDGARLHPHGWLHRSSGGVTLGTGNPPDSGEVIEAGGGFISPRLVDTHVHGGGGFAAERGAADMQGAIDFHAHHGVGSTLLSLMTDTAHNLVSQLEDAKAVTDPRFLGIHLEGPFLSSEWRGCHPLESLRSPSDEELKNLIACGEGVLMSMTVAPELFTQRQLDLLRDAGIKLCLGHTSCDYEVATKFFQDSSHVMTHAFNGMRGIHHREPGPILAALEAGAYTELIADGHHVSPSAARLLNPDKVILVTDAMAATGQGDGHYALGSTEVEVHQGVARDSRGSLAGSTLLLHMAVTNYAKWTNNPEAALRAAITNPTDAYGLSATGLERGLILWDNTMGMVRNL